MLAWSSNPNEEDNLSSAAQFRADRRLAALDNLGGGRYDSPYPSMPLSTAEHYTPNKNPKQVDRIAEAWGIHEPEPYEEFFGTSSARANGDTSAASSIRGGVDSHNQNGRKRAQNGRELREHFKDYLDTGRSQPVKRTTARNLPPPQPIDLPGAATGRPSTSDSPASPLPSPGLSSPGQTKRSKSIMQKFRKMRDAPNVPFEVAGDGDEDGSPPSSVENYTNGTHATGVSAPAGDGRVGRPVHRHQNSFFGRFGRNASAHAGQISPTSDTNENYIYVERSNKALPPRPQDNPGTTPDEKEGYFDAPVSPGGTPITSGGGLNRKTSLLKKVKGVVRGGNK